MEETVPVRPMLKDNALLGCRSEESESKRAGKESFEKGTNQEVTGRERKREDEGYQREDADQEGNGGCQRENAGEVGVAQGLEPKWERRRRRE